jgi:hypothetical protein
MLLKVLPMQLNRSSTPITLKWLNDGDAVPEGHLVIARNAGNLNGRVDPLGRLKGNTWTQVSAVPSDFFWRGHIPALKRWATFVCPPDVHLNF